MTQSNASAAIARASGAPDPLIGRTVNDRFKIVSMIARGGMGKVYRAEQAPLGRVCAVKVLNPNYAGDSDPEFHKRFFLEASVASKLTHPNTVTIFDYGRTDDDIYYMAMEFLEGITLHRAIRDAGFFPSDRAAHVARQICRALREAHSLGVIHRDLKPANIFLVQHGDESDFVKVLDFGLVKDVSDKKVEELTQAGLFMGSPKYMAPEQIRGDRVDQRTDIYALGCILYEMVTGKVPFDRPNSVNILMAHVNEEVPPLRTMNPNLDCTPELEQTIFRCLEKEPDVRFRSMDEVLASLKRVGGAALTATLSGIAGTGEYRALSVSGGQPVLSTRSGASRTASGAYVSGTGSHSGAVPAGVTFAQDPNAQPAPGARRLSKGVLIASVAGGLALLAGIAVIATRPSSKANAGVPSATAAVAAPPSTQAAASVTAAAPATTAAASSGTLKIRINSDPEGASVKEEGVEVCTATPCDLRYAGGDADPNKEHKLTISKGGFKPEEKKVKAADSPVSVKLTKQATWTAPPTEKPALPPGYKPEIPY